MESNTREGAVQPIRVLICNRYTLFREGLKALLEQGLAVDVAGEAATSKEAIRQMTRIKPDVVLLDATTPDGTGSKTVRKLKSIDPTAKILILSMDDDEPLMRSCIEAGAVGYIRKNDSAFNLKRVINQACGREVRAA